MPSIILNVSAVATAQFSIDRKTNLLYVYLKLIENSCLKNFS